MRKNVLLLILFTLLFPMFVWAEECDSSNISIGSLELVDKSDNTVIVNEASVVDNKINLDLKFSNVEDYAQYSFVIKNDSKEDYELSDKSININSDYIDYTLSTDDNLNIIKAGEEKKVLLNVKYNKEVDSDSFENGEYKENKVMNLNYSYNNKTNPVVDILENPKTGAFKYVLILVVLIISVFLIVKERKKSKIMLLLLMLMIPLSINALCTCNISIESNVVIEKKEPKILTFTYKRNNCSGDSIEEFDFEFLENTTFEELIESDYFVSVVKKKAIEKGYSEEQISDGYIDMIKNDIKYIMIEWVNEHIIVENNNDNRVEYNIDNIGNYVLKENYNFKSNNLC